MTFALGLLIGASVIGAPVGFFAAALAQAAAKSDTHLNPVSRKQAADEQRVWDGINRKERTHGQETE